MTAPRSAAARAAPDVGRRSALRFVVLVGIVSLFADMAYEGARSITGPYLALLGASATVVGIVAGVGELLGYSLRLLSGRLSDRMRAYWPIAIVGYVVQMAAVPALALAGSWQLRSSSLSESGKRCATPRATRCSLKRAPPSGAAGPSASMKRWIRPAH